MSFKHPSFLVKSRYIEAISNWASFNNMSLFNIDIMKLAKIYNIGNN